MADIQYLKHLIATGEKIKVEFKLSDNSLSRSLFESICAFLNRKGGHIFLGVTDKREIVGINPETANTQMDTLAKDMNNPQIINPPYSVTAEPLEIERKTIIYIYVPESTVVHSYKNQYFDRNHEGDFILKTQPQISNLFLRKAGPSFIENKLFPAVTLDDFDQDTFDYVKKYVRNSFKSHPWKDMSLDELLSSAGMKHKDPQIGKDCYTLAALLIFGKEPSIFRELPYYVTDALLRINDTTLYEDRDQIRCNLIQALDRLMAFVRKHLPEMPYIENLQRISLRDEIFREVACNMLFHREFLNQYRATFTIYKDRVETKNWNLPYQMGLISPDNLDPHAKNPIIVNFFSKLGWIEALGSGTRKTFKYCPIMVPGSNPVFDESDVFTATIPIPKLSMSSQLSDNLSDNLSDKQKAVLQLIAENGKIKASEIASKLSISRNSVNTIISQLKGLGKIERIGGDFGGCWKVIGV